MLRLGSIFLLAMLPAASALAQQTHWIAHTWDVVAADQTENGQTQQYLGPNPKGRMIFQPNGTFSIILLRSDLPAFKSNARTSGTPEENAAIVRGSLALYGTYKLDGKTLRLHVDFSSFPNCNGVNQTRTANYLGNKFTYENEAASAGGGCLKITLQKVE